MVSRESLYDQAMVLMHVPGLKLMAEAPATYKQLDELVDVSEKGIRFMYRKRPLWLPKRHVLQIRDKREFWATTWAIEMARNYESRKGST